MIGVGQAAAQSLNKRVQISFTRVDLLLELHLEKLSVIVLVLFRELNYLSEFLRPPKILHRAAAVVAFHLPDLLQLVDYQLAQSRLD